MDSSTYREKAGVLVSAIVVLALIVVGPAQLVVQVLTGESVTFDNTWLVTLMEPLGIRALGRTIRYWSAAERNTMLPPLAGSTSCARTG